MTEIARNPKSHLLADQPSVTDVRPGISRSRYTKAGADRSQRPPSIVRCWNPALDAHARDARGAVGATEPTSAARAAGAGARTGMSQVPVVSAGASIATIAQQPAAGATDATGAADGDRRQARPVRAATPAADTAGTEEERTPAADAAGTALRGRVHLGVVDLRRATPAAAGASRIRDLIRRALHHSRSRHRDTQEDGAATGTAGTTRGVAAARPGIAAVAAPQRTAVEQHSAADTAGATDSRTGRVLEGLCPEVTGIAALTTDTAVADRGIAAGTTVAAGGLAGTAGNRAEVDAGDTAVVDSGGSPRHSA